MKTETHLPETTNTSWTSYLLGTAIFLFVLFIILTAIDTLFTQHQNMATLAGTILVLICSFIGWQHYDCHHSQGGCEQCVKKCIKPFKWVFTALCINSIAVFALEKLETAMYMQAVELVFWFLFAALLAIGAQLALITFEGDDSDSDHPASGNKNRGSVYGKAGYNTKN